MFLDFSSFCPFWWTGSLSLLQADAGDGGSQSCLQLYMDHFSQWLLRNLQILNKEKEEGLWEREEVGEPGERRNSLHLHRYLSIPKEQRTGLWMRKQGCLLLPGSTQEGGHAPKRKGCMFKVDCWDTRDLTHCSPQLRRSLEGAEYTKPEDLHG